MTREELERRVCRVRQELEEAAGDRWPVPKLIAVTKTHSAEEILPLKEMGVSEIGENRVQELRSKLPAIRDCFGILRQLLAWTARFMCRMILPRKYSTRASPKGTEVPMPRLVITVPSHTTLSQQTSAPVSLSSRPG